MTGLPPALQDRINSARTVDGGSSRTPPVPYAGIGELLGAMADRHEEKPFLIFYSEEGGRFELSYREFLERVSRAAGYMASLGIVRGDRIATLSPNHPDVVVQYFAAFLLGAAVVPLNPAEDDRRLAYILESSRARLVLVRDRFAGRITSLASSLPSPPLVVESGPTPSDFPQIAERFSPRFAGAAGSSPDDVALIVYTSGTTGNPKGVVLTQHNLLADASSIAEWHRISEDQRMMCVLPLHHVNGIVVTLMTPLVAGAGVVLNARFQTEKFFERIGFEKVTVASVVPTLLQFLLRSPHQLDAYRRSGFRHVICGAGPLTVELAMKFEKTFGIPVIHGYGLSETTCYSCFLPQDLATPERHAWLSRHGFPSIGVPLPINEMAIHDGDGNELAEGQRGEIVIRGENVMAGYFEDSAANEHAFAHGWFRSGDEGFFLFDDQGRKFFFISGRLKELIIRGGVNISPFEIDEVLMKMPGIAAGIAVGFENDWYGEEVGAYVALKQGAAISEEQILEYCRRHLPFNKAPKVVVFGAEVPTTSTGKYQRGKCRGLFAPWKEAQFSQQKDARTSPPEFRR